VREPACREHLAWAGAAPSEPKGPAGTAEALALHDVEDGHLPLRDWVPRMVEEIVEGFDPQRVILFGSVARGEETVDSDVDLMVVFDSLDGAHRRELQGQLMAAITAPVPFDVFVTDVAEFEAKKDVNGTIAYWPSREGVVVHERSVA
jgi:predicted nucleotidyltransferase